MEPPASKRLPGFADPKKPKPKPILKKGASAWKQRSDSEKETRAKVRDWILPKAKANTSKSQVSLLIAGTSNDSDKSDILTAEAIADAAVESCTEEMTKPAAKHRPKEPTPPLATTSLATSNLGCSNSQEPTKNKDASTPQKQKQSNGNPTAGYAIAEDESRQTPSPIRRQRARKSALLQGSSPRSWIRASKTAADSPLARTGPSPLARIRPAGEHIDQPPAKKMAREIPEKDHLTTKVVPKKKKKKQQQQQTKHQIEKNNDLVWEGSPTDVREGIDWTGWTKRSFKRKGGHTVGRLDHYWYTPRKNYKLRSMKEVERFCAALKSNGGDEDVAYAKAKTKG